MDMHLVFGRRLGLLVLTFPAAVRTRRGVVMFRVMSMVGDTGQAFTMPTEVAVRAMRVSMFVIMPMRRRCVFWLRESALFTHFLRLSHPVVKCIPTP